MNELNQLAVTDEMMLDEREQIIDQLMREYSDDILHLVYTYVKNRTIAEDLAQEIFIKCYEKLNQFNQQSTIKTWLYRIASNHCKDYLRSWHYRKITLSNKVFDHIPSKSKQVEEEVIKHSEENSLTNAVMNLPLKYREVVFLHYYEELSLKEISKITSVNINTLKTRLKRAKELLKDKMIEEV
ncbi:sigma-70 family RNA polymerase sigma factor [Oceanobacillus sp. 143]|jgi:RNA polymerase sigma-70 factor (ECF subfamily)|uniref:RNA polymerase factor sigma C n=1 Tax=Oceanobacillus zhaokaii TaxID=2052660 RepID=A0A345PEN4_9BACI|nr:sigma-70 family RNA polymerase sigma factor [Oceanobacillus zhaokaii]AXI08464.1 RNA polymerase factor sigma C [Oceanobacillus zhaokaii]AXI09219.1 RNA polymerase factor sigma C [Oceanobacillus zhaokaii]QGS68325.1 sigma-70 family RNA polymerase sigma factor [Oceanobacillus sp. 143]QGS68744.1 sigma-70 family RNA polymerase sigma factor [Oceanobacillus sp. 143]